MLIWPIPAGPSLREAKADSMATGSSSEAQKGSQGCPIRILCSLDIGSGSRFRMTEVFVGVLSLPQIAWESPGEATVASAGPMDLSTETFIQGPGVPHWEMGSHALK